MINIRKLIKSSFIFLGLEPPRKIPKKSNIKEWLEKPALEFKKISLESLVLKIKNNNDHDYYDLLLGECVNNQRLDFKEREFIGYGVGKENLNCYRKITLKNNEVLFEKTYYSEIIKLESLKWFDSNLAAKLNENIKIPNFKYFFHGGFITVIYFDFLKLDSLDHKNFEAFLIEASLALYEFSSLNLKEVEVSIPNFFQEFKKHNYYARNIQYAEKKANGILNLKGLEILAKNGPYVLSHGDLSETNVYKNKTIIDWDSCGYFPLGLDIAKIYFRLIVNNIADLNYIHWLNINYKNSISKQHWNDLIRNFLLFLFVFVQDLDEDKSFNINKIEKNIISELEGI